MSRFSEKVDYLVNKGKIEDLLDKLNNSRHKFLDKGNKPFLLPDYPILGEQKGIP